MARKKKSDGQEDTDMAKERKVAPKSSPRSVSSLLKAAGAKVEIVKGSTKKDNDNDFLLAGDDYVIPRTQSILDETLSDADVDEPKAVNIDNIGLVDDDDITCFEDLGAQLVVNLTESASSMSPGERRKFYLKGVQFLEGDMAQLMFCTVPEHSYHSSFTEMMLVKILREKLIPLLVKLGFSMRHTYGYIDGDEDHFNNKGYNVRLFATSITALLTTANFRRLLEAIAKALNEFPDIGNRNVVVVPEDFLFQNEPVWSTLIGYDKAAQRLLRITGPPNSDDYWTTNIEIIRAHFKPNQVPFRCAQLLRAPSHEVMYDPEVPAMEPGVGNDD